MHTSVDCCSDAYIKSLNHFLKKHPFKSNTIAENYFEFNAVLGGRRIKFLEMTTWIPYTDPANAIDTQFENVYFMKRGISLREWAGKNIEVFSVDFKDVLDFQFSQDYDSSNHNLTLLAYSPIDDVTYMYNMDIYME